ncbi:hypothetical protein CRUP_023022 [Coryphaenoides rupestris]|nr:hypothetical protein CRUP_023022 [Coryphaenoides rupestris]
MATGTARRFLWGQAWGHRGVRGGLVSRGCRSGQQTAAQQPQDPQSSAFKPAADSTRDWIGPPNRLSNIRPITYHVPAEETALEERLRRLRQQTEIWNHEFWAQQNITFSKEKDEYISSQLKARGLALCDEKGRSYHLPSSSHLLASSSYHLPSTASSLPPATTSSPPATSSPPPATTSPPPATSSPPPAHALPSTAPPPSSTSSSSPPAPSPPPPPPPLLQPPPPPLLQPPPLHRLLLLSSSHLLLPSTASSSSSSPPPPPPTKQGRKPRQRFLLLLLSFPLL